MVNWVRVDLHDVTHSTTNHSPITRMVISRLHELMCSVSNKWTWFVYAIISVSVNNMVRHAYCDSHILLLIRYHVTRISTFTFHVFRVYLDNLEACIVLCSCAFRTSGTGFQAKRWEINCPYLYKDNLINLHSIAVIIS